MGILDGKLGGVTALAAKFGGSVTLRRMTDGDYDPATGEHPQDEEFGSPQSLSATWWDVSTSEAEIRNGIVQPGARWVLVDGTGLNFTPKAGDIIEFAGEATGTTDQFRVVAPNGLSTGGANAAYQLLVEQRSG